MNEKTVSTALIINKDMMSAGSNGVLDPIMHSLTRVMSQPFSELVMSNNDDNDGRYQFILTIKKLDESNE